MLGERRGLSRAVLGKGALCQGIELAGFHIGLKFPIPFIGNTLFKAIHQFHNLIPRQAVDGLFDFQ